MGSTTLRDLFGANILGLKEATHGSTLRIRRRRDDPHPVVNATPAPDPPSPPEEGSTIRRVGSAIAGLRRHVSTDRDPVIDVCGRSLRAFCLEYLPHHFTSGFCAVHDDLFAVCDAPSPATGKRVARAAPRKFGKTTIISLAKPLQELAYQRRHFILMIGETATTAEANLATLTAEVENNERLRADFPHLVPARDRKGQPVKWTDKQIVFSDFATVMAKGMGGKARGIKYRQNRPDLAVCDDLESPETADTFLKRLRHKRWWGGTFLGLGATGWDIFNIGNLVNHDSLLASLLRAKDWNSKLWRALNIIKDEEMYPTGHTISDGSPIWPDVWGQAALDALKNSPEVGEFNFAREMMNDPKTREEQQFVSADFTFYDHDTTRESRYIKKLTYIDPAGGEQPGQMKKGRRDYFCAVTGGVNPDDNWIEIFDVQMKRLIPDQQIEKVLDVYATHRAPIQIEDIMYKNLYASSMSAAAAKRNLYPPITTRDVHGQNKNGRILGTQPLMMHRETRKVRFARHLLEMIPEYFGQFDDYPGEYDDGPDATEGVIRGLEIPPAPKNIMAPSLQRQSSWRNM